MSQPIAQKVFCIKCQFGFKGDGSCQAGRGVRTLAGGGCFAGAWLADQIPLRILEHPPRVCYPNLIPVTLIEADTYEEAWGYAHQAGLEQWIWVKERVPQPSIPRPTLRVVSKREPSACSYRPGQLGRHE